MAVLRQKWGIICVEVFVLRSHIVFKLYFTLLSRSFLRTFTNLTIFKLKSSRKKLNGSVNTTRYFFLLLVLILSVRNNPLNPTSLRSLAFVGTTLTSRPGSDPAASTEGQTENASSRSGSWSWPGHRWHRQSVPCCYVW